MNDELKGRFFRDIAHLEAFQAQLSLETEILDSLINKLTNIDLQKSDVSLEYARLRGSIDVLKLLKNTRERLVEAARSRTTNS